MTPRRWAAGPVLLAAVVGLTGGPHPPPAAADDAAAVAPSPTGRNPKLLWTPARQAVWNKMRVMGHPWWRLVQDTADKTGTKAERYGDVGLPAALLYQVTGDPRYAAKAYARVERNEARSRNYTRETFAEHVVLYDWLYPALTPAQRAAFYGKLNDWADLCLGAGPKPWGTRTPDSDELVGHYFGLALLDLATGPDNPRAGSFLKATWTDKGKVKPVGGLDATAADDSTMRNAVARFAAAAAGGEWIESDEYNLGTLKLLLIGAEGVRTATGKDHFPELSRLIPQLALAQVRSVTPDLKAAIQWGDVEHPRNLDLNKRTTLLAMLAGLTRDDPAAGPYAARLVDDLVGLYGATGYKSAEPTARALLFYDPYAPRKDWRALLPEWDYRAGQGMLVHRTADGLFAAHVPNRVLVDHEVEYFGDFQLYLNGEWAVTRPLGYGSHPTGPVAANNLLVGGRSSMYDRRPVAHAGGPGWAYLAGTTGGPLYGPGGQYDPPPAYVRELSRGRVYLPPAAAGGPAAVVVCDRVAADDPRKLPKADRYRPFDKAGVEGAPASAVEWVIHAPERPAAAGGAAAWKTPGGRPVRVLPLTPGGGSWAVVDEKELWGKLTTQWRPAELKYQARWSPAAFARWRVLLTVVQVGAGGEAVRVAAAGGESEGVLVRRPAAADVLTLFGGREEGRVLGAGYTVEWEAVGASTDLHLFDLDAGKRWSVRVDGGEGKPLPVGKDGGDAHLSVPGAGRHSIELTAG